MAYKNATRVGNFFTKKLLSQMIISIDEEAIKVMNAAGNFKVANLPENCVVQSASVYVEKTGAGGPVDVGTTEGGAEILDNADVSTAVGVVGTIVGKFGTGTGKPVFVTLAAKPTGKFHILIEYLELETKTGSMTAVDTTSA